MNVEATLSRLRVVLSRTTHPGNIGAAARAMKTMGLARLFLVRPESFPHPAARALAAGAQDVLDQAKACASLEEALAGAAIAIACTSRARELAHVPLDARAAAAEAAALARGGAEVALVFGSEGSGLTNEELMKCNRLASIPASAQYPSLNLGAAVQVMAYEVRMSALGPASPEVQAGELAPHEDVERFFAQLEQSITRSGFLHPRYPRRLMDRLRRLFGRTRLEKEEVNILRGMLAAWDRHPGTGPKNS